MTATAAPTGRLITLDALRGFAVMGILAMNIVGFAMPDMAYITPLASIPKTAGDTASWLAAFVLVDGKMRGLFSLLFGASMLLIAERATGSGQSAAQVHYRRMAWLAVFGLAHFFFVWFGDILFLYAVIGSIAFLARDWTPRRLIQWGLWGYAFGVLLTGLFFGSLLVLELMATAPEASPQIVKIYRDVMSDPEFSLTGAEQLAVYRGSYADIVAHRLAEWGSLIGLVLQSIGETLPLMWIGMALYKTGFLTGRLDHAVYLRWAVRLVPLGLLLSLGAGLGVWVLGLGPVAALNGLFVWSAVSRLMLTVGYAALLVMAVRALDGTTLLKRVAAAGQAAFTNYLATSIVMTSIFYGYGLGLFGTVGRPWLWLFVLGGWAAMLSWSKPWLMRFRYGPFEWLWRSLARWQLQPLRRKI